MPKEYEANDELEDEKRRVLEQVQAQCKHSRAVAHTHKKHMLFKCLDCGKYFYKEVKRGRKN